MDIREEQEIKHLNDKQHDENGLVDFHKSAKPLGVDVDQVGINRFRIPVQYAYKDGTVLGHDAEASLFVKCPKEYAGINMSRMCKILMEDVSREAVNTDLFKTVLGRLRDDMRESKDVDLLEESRLSLKFQVALKQASLKSANWGWQYYDCTYEGREDANGKVKMFLTLAYEYSSTCPCSLCMSLQYEEEYQNGQTSEGNGVATPHSQRSQALVTIEFPSDVHFSVECLVQLLRKAIPTETQSFVKRVDEQAFAILNGSHPVFVEHVAAELKRTFDLDSRILDWSVDIEHWESLHSHNAAAHISKGIPGGLR